MLRIFVLEEPFIVTFRLGRELMAQTASQFIDCRTQVRSTLDERKTILELGDVVELDETGRNLLGSLANAGVRVGYAHPNLQALIKDLARRHGNSSSHQRSSSVYRAWRLLRSIFPSRQRYRPSRTN